MSLKKESLHHLVMGVIVGTNKLCLSSCRREFRFLGVLLTKGNALEFWGIWSERKYRLVPFGTKELGTSIILKEYIKHEVIWNLCTFFTWHPNDLLKFSCSFGSHRNIGYMRSHVLSSGFTNGATIFWSFHVFLLYVWI
jgi:hypothetical protein